MVATAGFTRAGPRPDGTRPRISVVIVSWNTRELAIQCVQSLVEHCDLRLTELILVDNASRDGTAASLRDRFSELRVIESERNLGGGRGFNLGMREAAGELILLMQPDAYVCDAVIQRMAEFMWASPDVGMVGCELRYPDGRHQYTAHRDQSIRLAVLERFWLYKLWPKHRRARLLLDGYWPPDQAIDADWLAAVCMVRREAFERTGGIDERFIMGGEESEWARRIRGLGYRVAYEPRLGVIYHVGSASWGQIWTDRGRLRQWHRLGIEGYALSTAALRRRRIASWRHSARCSGSPCTACLCACAPIEDMGRTPAITACSWTSTFAPTSCPAISARVHLPSTTDAQSDDAADLRMRPVRAWIGRRAAVALAGLGRREVSRL